MGKALTILAIIGGVLILYLWYKKKGPFAPGIKKIPGATQAQNQAAKATAAAEQAKSEAAIANAFSKGVTLFEKLDSPSDESDDDTAGAGDVNADNPVS